MVFYQLMHIHPEDCDAKDNGYFSSLAEVEKAKEHLLRQPGFSDYPDGFFVVKRSAPNLFRDRPFYEALIYYHTEDYFTEYSTTLGYYPNREQAQKAIDSYAALNPSSIPGIIREDIVNRRVLNRAGWPEGFVSDPGERTQPEAYTGKQALDIPAWLRKSI